MRINLRLFGGRGAGSGFSAGTATQTGNGGSTESPPSSGFVDHSQYKADHDEVVNFVKQQVGLDLNQYRDDDGSSPSGTAYWDKNEIGVAFNHNQMNRVDMQKLQSLTTKNYGITIETGGAWFSYVYLKKWFA